MITRHTRTLQRKITRCTHRDITGMPAQPRTVMPQTNRPDQLRPSMAILLEWPRVGAPPTRDAGAGLQGLRRTIPPVAVAVIAVSVMLPPSEGRAPASGNR
jgi:hypothetical protein